MSTLAMGGGPGGAFAIVDDAWEGGREVVGVWLAVTISCLLLLCLVYNSTSRVSPCYSKSRSNPHLVYSTSGRVEHLLCVPIPTPEMPRRSVASTAPSSSSRLPLRRSTPAVIYKVEDDSDDEIQFISHTPTPRPTIPQLRPEMTPEALEALLQVFRTSEDARASLAQLYANAPREAAPSPEAPNRRSRSRPQARASVPLSHVITIDDSDEEANETMSNDHPKVLFHTVCCVQAA